MSHGTGHNHLIEHDWDSIAYVDEWIATDLKRESRRAVVRRMLSLVPLPREAELSTLDVGAGDGLVTEEVLREFPNARVVLLDRSEPMLERAREHLDAARGRVAYVRGDLATDEWTGRVGGPFDLVVSAIAIHNLRRHDLIAACYRAIFSITTRGGMFLDCDLVTISGGLDAHLEWLREAGFSEVECVLFEEPRAVLVAHRP